MNKKADVFLYGFVLIAIALLATLSFVIQTHEEKRSEEIPVGEQAGNLLKLYSEGEKIYFFYEQSSKLAKKESIKKQFANGGYYKNCQASLGTGLAEWTSCPNINLQKAFLKYYSEEIKKYHSTSVYFNEAIRAEYELLVKKSKPIMGYPNGEDDLIITKFEPIIFNPEHNTQFDNNVKYHLQIQTELDPSNDFEYFKDIYQKVSLCMNTDDPLENCKKDLKAAGAKVTVKDPILNIEFEALKFSINTEKELPELVLRSL